MASRSYRAVVDLLGGLKTLLAETLQEIPHPAPADVEVSLAELGQQVLLFLFVLACAASSQSLQNLSLFLQHPITYISATRAGPF